MAAAPPVPASSVPARDRRPNVGRAALAAFLGLVVVPLAAFVISGTLLTVGLFVLPALVVAAVLYLAWSARRRAERDTGLSENPAGSGAAPTGPRGGTYG
jgi:threonine/homoserine/homoserine lactone efflux protein